MCYNIVSSIILFCKELSEVLLCDLTLHFSHPVKMDALKETETTNLLSEESKISDVSLSSNSSSL